MYLKKPNAFFVKTLFFLLTMLIFDFNRLIKQIIFKKGFFFIKTPSKKHKIFKKNTLSRVIVTEENKFWKFLSKKKYLNENQLNLDQRLLKNFYLNEGFYNVNIN